MCECKFNKSVHFLKLLVLISIYPPPPQTKKNDLCTDHVPLRDIISISIVLCATASEMFLIIQKMFKQYKYKASIQKLGKEMVAHSTTKNLNDLEIDNVVIILCYNDGNIELLLYFGGPINVPNR